ncbi:MAG TPA: N-acetyltransferase [Euryarchaeota archaeon]|nr:N-acetyltransferase [Euryarchaeota archaeon]
MEIKAKHFIVQNCKIGEGTIIRDYVNLFGCTIGKNCKIGAFAEIGRDAVIGDNCKIEAYAFIPTGVKIEDDVFVGPHACFTNDRVPRAVGEWKVIPTLVKKGASIGANATVICGVTIGENAIVGAGSVVTKDVPANTVVVGSPAKILRRKTE